MPLYQHEFDAVPVPHEGLGVVQPARDGLDVELFPFPMRG